MPSFASAPPHMAGPPCWPQTLIVPGTGGPKRVTFAGFANYPLDLPDLPIQFAANQPGLY